MSALVSESMRRACEERQGWTGEGCQPSQNKSGAFPLHLNSSLQPWKGKESRNQVSTPSSSRMGWPMFTYANKWKDRRIGRMGEASKWDVIQEGFLRAPPDLQELMEWSWQWWWSRVSSLLASISSPGFRVPVLPSSSSSSFT